MIPVQELLYDIDLKLNKVATNEHQNIPLEDKLIALNDAQVNIIKTKYSENNLYKLGMDAIQKRYNDLEILVEKDKYLPMTEDKNPLKSWSSDLSLLKPTYMLGIPGSEYILADKGSCKNNPIVVNQVKHADINTALKNTNTAPSFEFQETIGVISNHKFQVFTNGDFKPNKFYLWYLRYPVKVDYPGYTHFNGSSSYLSNSELPYFLKEEIVDIAVKNLALSTENFSAVQSSQVRIQNDE